MLLDGHSVQMKLFTGREQKIHFNRRLCTILELGNEGGLCNFANQSNLSTSEGQILNPGVHYFHSSALNDETKESKGNSYRRVDVCTQAENRANWYQTFPRSPLSGSHLI